MTGALLQVEYNRFLLQQGMALLERLDDVQYAGKRNSWAPVGAQYRHVLDHYQSFLRGLPSGQVDYDARTRDEWVEQSRFAALTATNECLDGLTALTGAIDRPILVQMDSGAGPDLPDWRPSSAGRELQFLCSHTIHHYALIRLLLEGAGVDLDPAFGVAPSTLSYQRAALH
jgi:hypothetical protein